MSFEFHWHVSHSSLTAKRGGDVVRGVGRVHVRGDVVDVESAPADLALAHAEGREGRSAEFSRECRRILRKKLKAVRPEAFNKF